MTDSLGNTTSYSSEMVGGTWVEVNSNGSGCSSCTVRGNISQTLDASGNVLTTTDELGHVTTFTYDAAVNMTSQSQQLDANTPVTTTYTYNSFGEPKTVKDPLGNITTNTYDSNGNLLTVTTPAPDSSTPGSVTQFTYDSQGQLKQITDPLGNITKLTYNSVGLIATITDMQQNVTTYGYDQHGNRTSVTDQNNETTTYKYDDADRLISVTDAAQNVTTYQYDTENNLQSITDASKNITSFAYDAFRRVTKTTFPSMLTESYLYDAAGNLVNKTDRNKNSILYVYDALNRLTHKGYPDTTGVDYVYDLAGKIKQVTDPTGTYAMAYDNMGRLIGTTTTYSFLPGPPFSNTYAYDAASNRTSLTLPDGSTDTYQYDTLNRLSKLTDSLIGQFNFSYDGLGRRTQLTRPNGVNSNYSYDSLSRLLSVLHQTSSATLDGATYTYDPAGNRASKASQLSGVTEQYTYDSLNQLTQVVQGTTTTESYTYDTVGNRLTSVGVPSYSYNSSNELTSNSAAAFTYDSNGNTLTKADSTGTRTYKWDFENRLNSVALPGTGGTVTFKYDPFGRRIQKAFTQNSTTTVTNYLYHGANVVEELDGSGNELARYAQNRLDEPFAETRSGAASFYEQDDLGSVTSLSGSGGLLSNTYAYDAFGNLTASSGTTTNPYQYTGRDYDLETGLRYYRARYYDPANGRFINEDPIGLEGGLNSYMYVDNQPTILVDPHGTQTQRRPPDPGTECVGEDQYGPAGCYPSNATASIPPGPPLRSPDYYQCTCGLSLKCLKGLAGPSGTIEIDFYGHIYKGAGPSGGWGSKKLTCACTANWIGDPFGMRPSENAMSNFLNGGSYSVAAGWWLVGQITWADGTSGPGIGLGTPQLGGGWAYSAEIQPTPPRRHYSDHYWGGRR